MTSDQEERQIKALERIAEQTSKIHHELDSIWFILLVMAAMFCLRGCQGG